MRPLRYKMSGCLFCLVSTHAHTNIHPNSLKCRYYGDFHRYGIVDVAKSKYCSSFLHLYSFLNACKQQILYGAPISPNSVVIRAAFVCLYDSFCVCMVLLLSQTLLFDLGWMRAVSRCLFNELEDDAFKHQSINGRQLNP